MSRPALRRGGQDKCSLPCMSVLPASPRFSSKPRPLKATRVGTVFLAHHPAIDPTMLLRASIVAIAHHPPSVAPLAGRRTLGGAMCGLSASTKQIAIEIMTITRPLWNYLRYCTPLSPDGPQQTLCCSFPSRARDQDNEIRLSHHHIITSLGRHARRTLDCLPCLKPL